MQRKGFTLIELLVVIAIIAILAVVVVLTLNPAQLLAQARDSNRLSDLGTLKSAISLYLADVASPSIGASANCYSHNVSITCTNRFTSGTAVTTTSQGITGSGWLPVNFTAISSGSPISQLPVDPTNNATYYYAYKVDATNLTFELNDALESTKYSTNAVNDGGNNTTLYEVGSAPGLAL